MTRSRAIGVVCLAAFIATVYFANYLVEHYGLVNVGFGLVAPAGVYMAGLALILRDAVQRTLGWAVASLAILAGAGLSAIVSTNLALASASAFLVSEACDQSIFTALWKHNLALAVLMGGIVGAAADSLIFLQIAFGGAEFFAGQWVAKMYLCAGAAVLIVLWRLRFARAAPVPA